MELEKRKRENEGEANGVRNEDCRKRVAPPPPADEEVEEFFAILKRVQVAIKYFQRRDNVGGESTAKSPWNPSFQREDFDGVKTEPECSPEYERKAGFDLNLDPAADVSDPV
ncbi:hypothetical protein ACS0TY_033253 [Phlomoides rotata]